MPERSPLEQVRDIKRWRAKRLEKKPKNEGFSFMEQRRYLDMKMGIK